MKHIGFLFQCAVLAFTIFGLQVNGMCFIRPIQTNPCGHFLLFHRLIEFLSGFRHTDPLGFDPAQAL